MKKRTVFLSSLAAFVAFGAILLSTQRNEMKEEGPLYQPRTASTSQSWDAKGSAEWLHAIRANHITGEINPQDYFNAREGAKMIRLQENQGIGNLSWEEIGPDNVGGRTRAFLIDRNDPNLLYSGGVSGGLFYSNTRGSSWLKVNDFQENLAVVSIAQAVNGDIYYGTGEGMYYQTSGVGTGGILGGGLFRKRANENEFSVIPSTVPTPANSTGVNFASIGVVITDLVDSNKLWIGTNQGYFLSTNGGASWENVIPFSGFTTDGVMDKNGGHWISVGTRGFYSPTGDPQTFTEITSPAPGPGLLPRSIGRMVFAVSPQDANYIYCVQTTGFTTAASQFHEAYRSTDGGTTWTRIGVRTSTFNPHGSQGGFDHAVTVDAWNKDRVFVGGVDFYEWSLSGGWQQVASRFRGSPFYVHVDHHRYVCDTTQPGLIYAVNDGGIFRSTNFGNTWVDISKGYSTSQFYGIGFSSTGGKVMGGTQDNGTILIDGLGNTKKAGVRTPGIDYRGANRDGDGGFAEISSLNSNIMVKAMQYGILGRSNNGGETFNEFYDFVRIDPNQISSGLSSAFAPFVTPFLLWEDQFDDNSQDTILFIARDAFKNIGFGLERSTFSGFINRPQAAAEFVPGTFQVIATPDTLTSDINGNIVGPGSGNINFNTGEYSITFNRQGGVTAQINATCAVRYSANDTIFVASRTQEIPIREVLTANLNSRDTLKILDRVQSMFAVGLNSSVTANGRKQGGLWLTRGLLDFSTATPEWYQVAHFGGSTTTTINISALAFSRDGDVLIVGLSNGGLHRISGLASNRNFATMDINSPDYNLEVEQIAAFGGRFITSVDIDQTNPDRVIVTLGGYGSSDNIRYSSNAMGASPTFASRQGNLPAMPVYSAIFNINAPSEVVIGTDFGIFSTANINTNTPTWSGDKEDFANVPVFMLRQQRNNFASRDSVNQRFNGIVYAASHGRGMWRTGSLAEANPLSVRNNEALIEDKENLLVFPNPTADLTKIRLEMPRPGDARVSIRSIQGAQVRSINLKGLSQGTQDVELSLEGLKSGTYIIVVSSPKGEQTAKVVKL